MQRVQKIFTMGLRWRLGEWGFMKREIEWDDKFTSLKVGPSVVVSVRISNQKLVCDWSPEWAQWEDLQNKTSCNGTLFPKDPARASTRLPGQ